MALTMKDRFAKLDLSKLPEGYKSTFDEMAAETSGFTDEDINKVLEEPFDEVYKLVEERFPDAIKKGGTLTAVKPAKVKVIKPKKTPAEAKYKPGDVVYYIEKDSDYFDPQYRSWLVTDQTKQAKPGIVHIMSSEHGTIVTSESNISHNKPTVRVFGTVTEFMRKKLSAEDIEFIESTLKNDEASTDEELIAHFVKETNMTEGQAKKWVALRDKYLSAPVEKSIKYSERTKLKKEARKAKDIVQTRDGKEFDRKAKKNVGKTFYDENGKAWKCKGYNAKLDECILEDSDGKEISSCIKDMYVSNPVTKREKGNLIDECKDTLKEAGFSVKEHKAGGKKIKRSEPRPEKVIIKERVTETFTPIMKDLTASEEKKEENKEMIALLNNIQALFVKVMNRISNLADDGKAEALKKIEKLFKELVD